MSILPELRRQVVEAAARPAPRGRHAGVLALGVPAAAAIALAVVVLSGGGEEERPARLAPGAEELRMTCQEGFSYSDDREFRGDWRARALTLGPVSFLDLTRRAQRPRRGAVYAKVLVAPGATTAVSVAPADRGSVSFTQRSPGAEMSVSDGVPTVVFDGCASRVDDSRAGEQTGTGYTITLVVARPRCATFEARTAGRAPIRRRISLGGARCEP